MTVKLRSWWQQIKQHWVAIGVVGIVLVVVIALIIVGYWSDWTGFNGYTKVTTTTEITSSPPKITRTEEYQPGKGLWDWLQLLGILAIPVVVGFGAAWFTAHQGKVSARENKDNQREAALQAYIDKMSELLIKEHLGCELSSTKGELTPTEEEVRKIARVRTLTTLEQLDGKRKRIVLQFLHESGLIDKDNRIISLKEANLKDANLRDIILRRADLREAYLYSADLRDADLSDTCLQSARLDNVKLDNATLSNADLSKARLPEAKLDRTDLSGADLSGANLCGTDLSGAKYNKEVIYVPEEPFQIKPTQWQGARYNTKKIPKKGEKGQPIIDQSREPVMIELITQWPPEFDPEVAGAICDDC